jgi:hypothetical protein
MYGHGKDASFGARPALVMGLKGLELLKVPPRELDTECVK